MNCFDPVRIEGRKMLKLFLFLILLPAFFHKSHASGNALMEVISDKPTYDKYCIKYNSYFKSLPVSVKDAPRFNLKNFSDIVGCDVSEYEGHHITSQSTIVGVLRGNCTFFQKAQVAETQNASAVLVIDYKTSNSIAFPWMNKTMASSFNISLAVIAWHDYHKLIQSGGQIQVSLYAPPSPTWDYNSIFMIFGSTLLILIAGLWSAHMEKQEILHQHARALRASQNDETAEGKETGIPITVCGVLLWLAVMCGVMLTLYFFFRYVVYIFIALFCLAGANSLYRCLLPLWTLIMPIHYDIPLNRLPFCKFKSKANLGSLILLMPCVTLAVFWAVQRHEPYAWVLQDILGACFCVYLITELRVLPLKIISIMLPLMLIYDVFFVFITPYLTPKGDSIMVSVATGGSDEGDSKSKELLPLLFLIPLLGDSPLYLCRDRPYTLLGFGDVIIPGFLIAHSATCDIQLRARKHQQPAMLYFIIGIIGYLVGMALCMVSMMLMETGQPALLYLIPCTMIPIITVALCRKELKLMFRGFASKSVSSLDDVEPNLDGCQVQDSHHNHDSTEDEVRPSSDDNRLEEEMSLIP